MILFIKHKNCRKFFLRFAKITELEREIIKTSGPGSVTFDELTLLNFNNYAETLIITRQYDKEYFGYWIAIYQRTYVGDDNSYATYKKQFTFTNHSERIIPF